MKKNLITEILGHDVSWYVNAPSIKEMDATTEDHIKESIMDGFTQGEICMSYGKNDSKETTGWWSIVDWKNTALKLYDIAKTIKSGSTLNIISVNKAIAEFDEQWG
jgi:hypothetical protein